VYLSNTRQTAGCPWQPAVVSYDSIVHWTATQDAPQTKWNRRFDGLD
jgi:hypothetical protein